MTVLMFVLASVAVAFTASIETTPPSQGGKGSFKATPNKGLNLSVFVVSDGFALKASGGNVAPGCSGAGAGIAVGKNAGQYDYAALGECVKRVKDSSPDFKDETQVTLTANPGTEYQVIINTMDAVRKTKEGEDLFPDVHFGAAR
jgi:hypothetical protein